MQFENIFNTNRFDDTNRVNYFYDVEYLELLKATSHK